MRPANAAIVLLVAFSLALPLAATSDISDGKCQWASNGIGIVYTDYRVGIGTGNPSSSLEVVGDVVVHGRLIIGSVDVGARFDRVEAKIAELEQAAARYAVEIRRVSTEAWSNITRLRDWLETNYYNRSEVDAIAAKIVHLVSSNLTLTREALESYIVGNVTQLRDWVEANYYNRSEVDSWRLIKNYRLEDDLDANGHDIRNAGLVHVGSDEYYAILTENGLFFNNYEFVIRPVQAALDERAVIYISGDVNDFSVGIGTTRPFAKLDVNGDIRADAVYTRSIAYSYYAPGIVLTPFGVATPLVVSKETIDRISLACVTRIYTDDGSTTLLYDTVMPGMYIVSITPDDWSKFDKLVIEVDGVVKEFPIYGWGRATLVLMFLVEEKMSISIHDTSDAQSGYLDVVVIQSSS